MCGILAVQGSPRAAEFVHRGLTTLGYRGYDSHGWVSEEGGRYSPVRRLGGYSGNLSFSGRTALAHTRWSTHGAATLENCHPIEAGICWVVHNGMVENADALRGWLSRHHAFRTDTDTEVIAALLAYYGGKYFPTVAVRLAASHLLGANAFCVLFAGDPHVYAHNQGGSLWLGVGDGFFASSDLEALSGFAVRASGLPDGHTARLGEDGVRVWNDVGGEVFFSSLVEVEVPDHVRPASKDSLTGGHMRVEMGEQAAYLRDPPGEVRLEKPSGVVLFGCGSSYYAARLGAFYIERWAGVPCRVEYATEMLDRPFLSQAPLVALTQSGETADTLEVMRRLEGRAVCLTNNPHSRAASLARLVVPLGCGPERGVAATKSWTAQVTRLCQWACRWGGKIEEDFLSSLRLAADRLEELFAREEEVREIARGLPDNVLLLGRGPLYPVAQEGALKLKEVAYIHAEGMHASEVKHGPLALLDEKTLAVFLLDVLGERTSANLQQVLARTQGVLAVCQDVHSLPSGCPSFRLPSCLLGEVFVAAAFLQLLAYHRAVLSGRDPDRPRHLAKSVTVL